jgi:hypothetical protein
MTDNDADAKPEPQRIALIQGYPGPDHTRPRSKQCVRERGRSDVSASDELVELPSN